MCNTYMLHTCTGVKLAGSWHVHGQWDSMVEDAPFQRPAGVLPVVHGHDLVGEAEPSSQATFRSGVDIVHVSVWGARQGPPSVHDLTPPTSSSVKIAGPADHRVQRRDADRNRCIVPRAGWMRDVSRHGHQRAAARGASRRHPARSHDSDGEHAVGPPTASRSISWPWDPPPSSRCAACRRTSPPIANRSRPHRSAVSVVPG